MKNKKDLNNVNDVANCDEKNNVSTTTGQCDINEKYRDQFTGLALETGRGIIHSVQENYGDYKAVCDDKNMSPVEKALGKRKILAADIGLSTLGVGSMLGLVWVVKRVMA